MFRRQSSRQLFFSIFSFQDKFSSRCFFVHASTTCYVVSMYSLLLSLLLCSSSFPTFLCLSFAIDAPILLSVSPPLSLLTFSFDVSFSSCLSLNVFLLFFLSFSLSFLKTVRRWNDRSVCKRQSSINSTHQAVVVLYELSFVFHQQFQSCTSSIELFTCISSLSLSSLKGIFQYRFIRCQGER